MRGLNDGSNNNRHPNSLNALFQLQGNRTTNASIYTNVLTLGRSALR